MKEIQALWQRLKDARLHRRFSMETVCVRADISRPTLSRIEQGDPFVAFGNYVQYESLPQRKRAPRKKTVTGGYNGESNK